MSSAQTCDVCSQPGVVGVAAIPGFPMSAAYCRACLEAGAHPLWALTVNTALLGGMEHAAPWWVDMVERTLAHLDYPRESFDTDVADVRAVNDMDATLERILTPQGAERWWRTPMRELDGRTPQEAIEAHDLAPVRAIVDSYLDPSFN